MTSGVRLAPDESRRFGFEPVPFPPAVVAMCAVWAPLVVATSCDGAALLLVEEAVVVLAVVELTLELVALVAAMVDDAEGSDTSTGALGLAVLDEAVVLMVMTRGDE